MLMMTNIAKPLESIICGTNNFCCLCLNICNAEDLYCSKDKVNIGHDSDEIILVWDLIVTVLGNGLTQYAEALDNFCGTCTTSLISNYNFIKKCYANSAALSNMFDGLNTAVQKVTKLEEGNSLFVSLSLNSSNSKVFYDNQKNHTPKMAIDRFKIISTPNPKNGIMKCDEDTDMLHDPSNPHIIQCKVCLKMFLSICKLRSHFLRAHHIENKYLQSSKKEVQKMKIVRTITCNECGEIYNSIKSLKKHQMVHKTLLVCPYCGRTYKNKMTYKNHVDLNICKQDRRHSPAQAKFTCDYCNKKYTQKMSLRVHIQFEHGNYKAHICEWCGKKFWAQSRLKAHIVKHTGEKKFSCHLCERKFVTKESLLYHTRLHTGEKPYKCPECSSTFLSASRRCDHIRRYHAVAKPGIQCDVCHGKFSSLDVLVKHKKTHEKNIFVPFKVDNNLIKQATIPPTTHKKVHVFPSRVDNNIIKQETVSIMGMGTTSKKVYAFPKNYVDAATKMQQNETIIFL